ncbi:MAG: hypothetical protein ACRD3A_14545 [Terriglobales bacterium]
MLDTYLVPEKTTVTAKGDGAALDVSAAAAATLLLTLHITRIVEQEALDVSVWGSPDGTAWGAKPLAAFPQKFYTGQHPLLLDLKQHPDVKFLRAHWDVNRWGRGSETPMFEFHVTLKQVPQEVLAEVAGRSRR